MRNFQVAEKLLLLGGLVAEIERVRIAIVSA
jgi:hypothetical protein